MLVAGHVSRSTLPFIQLSSNPATASSSTISRHSFPRHPSPASDYKWPNHSSFTKRNKSNVSKQTSSFESHTQFEELERDNTVSPSFLFPSSPFALSLPCLPSALFSQLTNQRTGGHIKLIAGERTPAYPRIPMRPLFHQLSRLNLLWQRALWKCKQRANTMYSSMCKRGGERGESD